jgi:hypothetical protein
MAQSLSGAVLQRQGVTDREWQDDAVAIGRDFASPGTQTPPPPKGLNGLRNGPDFSGVHVPRPPENINDSDLARALVTQVLIREFAPLLGLDPDRIQIHLDSSAEARLNARGTDGLMDGGAVYLHPSRFQVTETQSRELLAHEFVHAAQRKLTEPRSSAAAAEREANRIAAALVRRERFSRPRRALPANVSAAKESTPPPPVADLEALVRTNHARELGEIEKALSYGFLDWKITDAEAEEVLRILEPLSFPVAAALIGALKDPYPERLADHISADHFKRFRLPILAAYWALVSRKQAEKLQDDPFPGMAWKGLSQEEHFALHNIIKAFRDTGKGSAWYGRLSPRELEHVQDILTTTPVYDVEGDRQKAAEAEQKRKTESEKGKKLLVEPTVTKFLEKARQALSYGVFDWAVTDSEALSVLDDSAEFANEPAKMRVIVETLEGEGFMERLVDNVPVAELYTDVGKSASGKTVNRRKAFLQIVSFRPPERNAKKAEELLSYGLLDWALTDEDAFLAFQLVKSLPPKVREGFYAAEKGKYAGRLDDEMSRSMKQGKSTNYYTGGENGNDLKSVRSQLLEDGVWSKEQMGRLRLLIQFAIAAGEGAWVFAQAKDRFEKFAPLQRLYGDQEFFRRVVDAFRLYVPKGFQRADGLKDDGREEYVPDQVEGKPFGTDNMFWTLVIEGFGFIFHSNRIQVWKESIGGEGLDFGEFQDITGGTFLGAEFKRASKSSGPAKEELLDNSARWDLDRGILELRATRLDLQSVHYPLANLKFQTGESSVRGIHLHMQYPATESEQNSTSLRMRVDLLELNDVLLISPDSMMGFEQISVRDFNVDLSPDWHQIQQAAPSEDFAVGAIFFSPLFNLLKIKGIGALGVEDRVGELSKGLLTPPTPLNLTVTAGQLLLKGLTTSGGQYIDRIGLNDLVARSRTPRGRWGYRDWLTDERKRLEVQIESVKKQAATKSARPKPRHYVELETEQSLRLQLKSINSEIANLAEAEAEEKQLKGQQQTGKLSTSDEAKLKRVTQYLAGVDAGGVAVDVGHIEVHGIAGKVAAGDISLDDLHGYGHSAGAVLGFLSDSATLERMLRGPEYRGTIAGVEVEGDPMAFLKVRQIEAKAVDVQGKIPTVEEATAELAKVKGKIKGPRDYQLMEQRDRLSARLEAATIYWSVLEKDPGQLGAEDRDRFNKAREFLQSDKAFHADKITLNKAVLELTHGAGGTEVAVAAETLDAENIKAAGVKIDSIHGENIRASAGITGGLKALLDLGKKRSALRSAGASADLVRFKGVSHEASGAGLEELVIRDLGAQVKNSKTDPATVRASSIEATGFSWVLTERIMRLRQARLGQIPENKRTEAEKRQLDDIVYLLGVLKVNTDMLAEAEAQLNDPLLADSKRPGYEAQKKDATELLQRWQRQAELKKLTISDLDIGVYGFGDLLSDDFSIDKVLETGVKVVGQGKDKQIASGITGRGGFAQLGVSKANELPGGAGMWVAVDPQARVEEFKTGPIRGSFEYALDHIALDGFEIDSIDVSKFAWFGEKSRIWSDATCSIGKIKVTAKISTPLIDPSDPESDRSVQKVEITHFEVAFIEGKDLHYLDLTSKLHFDLTSARLRGIYANGVNVDLPKNKNEHLLIHGGSAGVAALEDARVAGATGAGLAFRGVLNANTLTATFAEDGKALVDLGQFTLAGGHIEQGDLDADINAKATGIHVALIPGAKGYDDATQKFRVDDLEASAKGKKGTTKFGVVLKSAHTGDITREPDGTIHAPEIVLPGISVNRLYFDSDAITVDMPEGQQIDLAGVQLSVTLEANKTPENKRKPGEFGFDRIVIHSLKIPIVVTRGMTITLKKAGIKITLPNEYSGNLKDIRLGADDDHPDEKFVLEPNNNWAAFGTLGVNSFNFVQLAAEMGDVLVNRAHIGGNGLSVGFLGAEGTTVDLDLLTAENVAGKLKGSPFTVITGLAPQGGDAKLTVRGIHHDKKGTTVREIDLTGFRYTNPDLGLTLDIKSARAWGEERADGMHPLTFTSGGTLKVPYAEINDAAFRIEDVKKLAGGGEGGGSAAGGGLKFGPDWSFLGGLNGHVNFTATPWAKGAKGFAIETAGPFKIRIRIESGLINFAQMEEESTGRLADGAADLRYKTDGDRGPRLQLKIIGLDPMWWSLDSDEAVLAALDLVRVSTFIKHELVTIPAPITDEPTKESLINNVSFGDVDIGLSFAGGTTINLGNAGSIVLGKGSTPGFEIEFKSGISAIRTAIPKLKAAIEKIDLKLDTGGTHLKTGAITIDGIRDGVLTFSRGGIGPVYTNDEGQKSQNQMELPKELSGILEKTTLHDVELQTPQKTEEKKK